MHRHTASASAARVHRERCERQVGFGLAQRGTAGAVSAAAPDGRIHASRVRLVTRVGITEHVIIWRR
jgi:hypothetical protein